MTLAASSLLIALLSASGEVSSVPPATPDTLRTASASAPPMRITSITAGDDEEVAPARAQELFAPRWTFDARRPQALPAMYAGFGALQALDIYSTRKAVNAGAREMNPLLGPASKNTAAMLAIKGASTALSIYFVERAWKRNRKGAMVLMTVLNGVTAAVVAKNFQNAR